MKTLSPTLTLGSSAQMCAFQILAPLLSFTVLPCPKQYACPLHIREGIESFAGNGKRICRSLAQFRESREGSGENRCCRKRGKGRGHGREGQGGEGCNPDVK
jgi:ribosomal protein RSM22 (predicted rRNA methylase)